jgi:hypothetical protein
MCAFPIVHYKPDHTAKSTLTFSSPTYGCFTEAIDRHQQRSPPDDSSSDDEGSTHIPTCLQDENMSSPVPSVAANNATNMDNQTPISQEPYTDQFMCRTPNYAMNYPEGEVPYMPSLTQPAVYVPPDELQSMVPPGYGSHLTLLPPPPPGFNVGPCAMMPDMLHQPTPMYADEDPETEFTVLGCPLPGTKVCAAVPTDNMINQLGSLYSESPANFQFLWHCNPYVSIQALQLHIASVFQTGIHLYTRYGEYVHSDMDVTTATSNGRILLYDTDPPDAV